jgi:hypothetical protein
MRLKIVGKHPHARGYECVIFGYLKAGSHAFAPIRAVMGVEGQTEISEFARWDNRPMRPSLGPETAPALVGVLDGGDSCRTSGRLVVLSHSWSGTLQINNIDRKYSVDLYSEQTRLVLLDLIAEIMVDLSALAAYKDGAVELPELTRETLLRVIVEDRAWFRFLEPDADFEPGLMRRLLGRRRKRADALKLQIVSRLLPELATRPAPPSPPPATGAGLRDEVRLLAAAVEGLALRAPAEA